MKLLFHPHILRYKYRFKIAHTTRDVQETLIVELQDIDHNGNVISGFGEATDNPYYHVTVEGMMEELEKIRLQIEAYTLADVQNGQQAGTPEAFWDEMYKLLKHTPFTLCALDMAAQDLYGKKAGQPLYKLWGLSPEKVPVSNYTIGIDTIEKMVQKLKDFPWPIYKIKLGTDEDVAIVRALRQHTNALFRVDANCAWNAEETIKNSVELKKLGVEFIEQPLPADQYEEMEEVYQHSVLPLVADESCLVESDVTRCHGKFHGINIKLTKCGGLTPARRMIAEAKKLGMKVMVGCMTESSVGISAIAQLTPLLDYVDMDGTMLIEKDVAKGVKVKPDGIEFSQENGTGASLLVNDALPTS